MKNRKYLITALIVAILLTAASLFNVSATETPAAELDLNIYAKTLALEDSINLTYAVPVSAVEDGEELKMLFWIEAQSEYVYGTQRYELTPDAKTKTVDNVECYIFTFKKLMAKHMTVDIYARAYATDGETERYGDLDKYSVLQYAYNKLGKTSSDSPDSKTKKLLEEMLEYGAAAQEYFGYRTDRLANASYYQIKTVNALLEDGTDNGLYLVGEQMTITAAETNSEGESFLYWENSAGAVVSEELSYTITVQSKNESYIAVYGTVQAPVVDPLIYTEQTDGTYSVKANPDVELPAAIAIPATYNGKAVTVIEDNAFLDCAELTNISLPYGIKTIGKKAFSGCTGLTELILPETVKTIGNRAFHNCTGLTEFTIPASVTSIGTLIFYKSSNLSTVYYNSTYYSSNNPFLNQGSITKIVFGGTSVPSYILQSNTKVKEVEILNNVKSIGNYAFNGCTSLTSVIIPDSVTSIGSYAFEYCTSLECVTIGDSVTSIGEYAFNGCTSLTSVTIGNSVTSIGKWAFYECRSLTSIEIPDSVMSIGNGTFWECTSLECVTIGDSVTSIGFEAFYGCTSLKSVYITDLEAWCNISFGDSYSNPMCNGASLYLNNELVTALVIPDSVTSIGNYAFEGCTSLKTVYYGGTASDWTKISIGYYNTYLKDATRYYYSETQPTTEGNYWHYVDGVPTIWEVIVEELSYTLLDNDTYEVSGIGTVISTDIVIPSTFNGKPVTSIGIRAFENCVSLTSVEIPDSVNIIRYFAFYNCTNIKNIKIGNGVVDIESNAFDGCSSIENISIPDSVINVGAYAFHNCTSLTNVYITNLEAWCTISFNDYWSNPMNNGANLYLSNELVIELEIPSNLVRIKQFAFYGCQSLRSVKIPYGVISIDDFAFIACTNLESIEIPDSVTSIGYYSLASCTSIISIEIPVSITSIGDFAFNNCTSLKTVYYGGTAYDWANISIGYNNEDLTDATRYYYSETQPTTTGNYWHYVDGVPTIWEVILEELSYTLLENDTYEVSGIGNVTSTDIVIPSTYNGKPVTSIGSGAFARCKSLTSVNIGDSVMIIGESAFYECTSLMSVEFPVSVTSISSGAFYGCTSLESVVIPDSVTSIGSFAFYYCTSLTSIDIPDHVTSIGSYAFSNCTSLTSIDIPDRVTSIGSYAFSNCTSLTKVYITYLEAWCNISFGNSSSNPLCNGSGLYLNNKLVTEIVIPDGVTSIGNWAFNGYTSLSSIEIPDSVTSFGDWAFRGCTSLKYNGYGNAYYLGNEQNPYLVLIKAKDTSISVCEVNEKTKFIHSGAFYECTSLTSIDIPDSVTSIGVSAFYYCTSLTSIEIPDGVTSIGWSTFYGCTSLTSIEIPDSVTSIGDWAFIDCTSLTKVYITDLESWYNISFGDSSSNPMYYGAILYLNNEAVTELIIPDSVTSIGSYIFTGCTSLTSVIIPDGVTSIDTYAFSGCTSLTSIEIPDSVTSIGSSAFRGCTSLTSIDIPDSVTSIGDWAFAECTSLTSIEIPDSVTSIGSEAFFGCTSLTSMEIPKSVKSISFWAFYGCTSLKTVYYGGTASDWGKISIDSSNTYLTNATRYYYSETQPTTEGNYWHYVDGVPTKW